MQLTVKYKVLFGLPFRSPKLRRARFFLPSPIPDISSMSVPLLPAGLGFASPMKPSKSEAGGNLPIGTSEIFRTSGNGLSFAITRANPL